MERNGTYFSATCTGIPSPEKEASAFKEAIRLIDRSNDSGVRLDAVAYNSEHDLTVYQFTYVNKHAVWR